jgi:hypothetical protein
MTTTLTPTELDALLRMVMESVEKDLFGPDFDEEWELAPLSMTRTTERECAEFWFERGRLAERGKMLSEQNSDYAEMLRVGRERG